jgi:hypothetical protein
VLSKCRGLLARYDTHAANFLALLKLACALVGIVACIACPF